MRLGLYFGNKGGVLLPLWPGPGCRGPWTGPRTQASHRNPRGRLDGGRRGAPPPISWLMPRHAAAGHAPMNHGNRDIKFAHTPISLVGHGTF